MAVSPWRDRESRLAIPTGMIFIPCRDGISHNEAESVTIADATAGTRVLAEVVFELAERT